MVDTIVRPPVEPPLTVDRTRRHWRRNVLVVLAGVVVGILTFSAVWIANDVPLAQGSFGFGTPRSDVRVTEVDAFDISGVVFDVPVGRRSTFRYRFSIRNDGPFPVTIRSIGTSSDRGDGSLGRRAVRVRPDAYAGALAYEPWHAFSVAPGDEAIVEMEAAYHGRCLSRGDALSWNREPVTFSMLGLTRHEDVMVGVEVRFVGSGDC